MVRVIDLQMFAEGGDQYSQFLLGFLFHNGFMVEQDLDSAQKWYEKSALQGFVLAQYSLYKLLWEKDETKAAIDWLKKAADARYEPAQAAMGSYYWRTSKTDEEKQLAAKWMLAAAENGHFPAIANAALMYEQGMMGEPSKEQALILLRKGAELGSSACAQMLADRLLKEEARVSEAEEGLKWLWYAAEAGETFAYAHIAELYRFGLFGAPVDEKIAELFDTLAGDALVKKFR